MNYGGALLALERHGEALEPLERALTLAHGPDSTAHVSEANLEKMRVFLGLAHYHLGQTERAREQWLEAVKENPSAMTARGLLAGLQRQP